MIRILVDEAIDSELRRNVGIFTWQIGFGNVNMLQRIETSPHWRSMPIDLVFLEHFLELNEVAGVAEYSGFLKNGDRRIVHTRKHMWPVTTWFFVRQFALPTLDKMT